MSASRSYKMIITNNSDSDLKCTNSQIVHGEWSDDATPQYIYFHSSGGWQSESGGLCTGTEAYVTYQFVANGGSFEVHYGVPYDGHNWSKVSSATNLGYYYINPGPDCPQGDNPVDRMTVSGSSTDPDNPYMMTIERDSSD